MDDAQIIARYFDRDQSAIAESADKYGNYCHSIAYGILRSREDAEECVNETWLQAWNAIPPQRPKHLHLFFAKLTRNLSISRWRRLHAEKRGGGELPLVLDELQECVDGTADVQAETELRAVKAALHQFLQGLPERELQVFLRRYFFAQGIPQIAADCGLTESNTSVILSRTRKKLREHLKKEGFDDDK